VASKVIPIWNCKDEPLDDSDCFLSFVLDDFYESVPVTYIAMPAQWEWDQVQHTHAWMPHFVAKNLESPIWGPLHLERWSLPSPDGHPRTWTLTYMRNCQNKDAWPVPDTWKNKDLDFFTV
jgi:hypothetical protein